MTRRTDTPALHPLAEQLLPQLAAGGVSLEVIVEGLEAVPAANIAWAVTSLLAVASVLPAATALLVRACASQAARLKQGLDAHQIAKETLTRDAQAKLRSFLNGRRREPRPVASVSSSTANSKGRSLGQLMQQRGVRDPQSMAVSRASWIR